MEFAAGTLGSPGIVIISPHTTTINSAPLERRTSLIGIVWFEGAPFKVGSVEKLYCVLAIQIGKSLYPSFSYCFNWSLILLSATMFSASYISLAIVIIQRGMLVATWYILSTLTHDVSVGWAITNWVTLICLKMKMIMLKAAAGFAVKTLIRWKNQLQKMTIRNCVMINFWSEAGLPVLALRKKTPVGFSPSGVFFLSKCQKGIYWSFLLFFYPGGFLFGWRP